MFFYCANAMDNQSVKGNDPMYGLTLSYTF